jgi:hypothetical protein
MSVVPVASDVRLRSPFDPKPQRLAVLDTSVLTSDVIAALDRGAPSSLLAAMRDGTFRGFITSSVWAEVPRVLADRFDESQGDFDLLAAANSWWSEYIPVLYVVDADGLPDSELTVVLAKEDPTDVATVRLVEILAPVVVFAGDKDLRRTGLVYPDWHQTRAALGKVGPVEKRTESVVAGGSMLAFGAAAGVKRIALWAQNNPVPAAFAGVVIAWMVFRSELHKKTLAMAKGVGPGLVKEVDDVFEVHKAGERVWVGAERGQLGTSLLHRVARLLAQASEPMNRTEMVRALGPIEGRGHRTLMEDLSWLLHKHPLFVEVAIGRWQVGRTDVSFQGD